MMRSQVAGRSHACSSGGLQSSSPLSRCLPLRPTGLAADNVPCASRNAHLVGQSSMTVAPKLSAVSATSLVIPSTTRHTSTACHASATSVIEASNPEAATQSSSVPDASPAPSSDAAPFDAGTSADVVAALFQAASAGAVDAGSTTEVLESIKAAAQPAPRERGSGKKLLPLDPSKVRSIAYTASRLNNIFLQPVPNSYESVANAALTAHMVREYLARKAGAAQAAAAKKAKDATGTDPDAPKTDVTTPVAPAEGSNQATQTDAVSDDRRNSTRQPSSLQALEDNGDQGLLVFPEVRGSEAGEKTLSFQLLTRPEAFSRVVHEAKAATEASGTDAASSKPDETSIKHPNPYVVSPGRNAIKQAAHAAKQALGPDGHAAVHYSLVSVNGSNNAVAATIWAAAEARRALLEQGGPDIGMSIEFVGPRPSRPQAAAERSEGTSTASSGDATSTAEAAKETVLTTPGRPAPPPAGGGRVLQIDLYKHKWDKRSAKGPVVRSAAATASSINVADYSLPGGDSANRAQFGLAEVNAASGRLVNELMAHFRSASVVEVWVPAHDAVFAMRTFAQVCKEIRRAAQLSLILLPSTSTRSPEQKSAEEAGEGFLLQAQVLPLASINHETLGAATGVVSDLTQPEKLAAAVMVQVPLFGHWCLYPAKAGSVVQMLRTMVLLNTDQEPGYPQIALIPDIGPHENSQLSASGEMTISNRLLMRFFAFSPLVELALTGKMARRSVDINGFGDIQQVSAALGMKNEIDSRLYIQRSNYRRLNSGRARPADSSGTASEAPAAAVGTTAEGSEPETSSTAQSDAVRNPRLWALVPEVTQQGKLRVRSLQAKMPAVDTASGTVIRISNFDVRPAEELCEEVLGNLRAGPVRLQLSPGAACLLGATAVAMAQRTLSKEGNQVVAISRPLQVVNNETRRMSGVFEYDLRVLSSMDKWAKKTRTVKAEEGVEALPIADPTKVAEVEEEAVPSASPS